jgi:hypothetical protein
MLKLGYKLMSEEHGLETPRPTRRVKASKEDFFRVTLAWRGGPTPGRTSRSKPNDLIGFFGLRLIGENGWPRPRPPVTRSPLRPRHVNPKQCHGRKRAASR